MSRRRIIIEYNEDAAQWEWEIQEFVPIGINAMGWRDVPGDSLAGQNEDSIEAFEYARNALKFTKGT